MTKEKRNMKNCSVCGCPVKPENYNRHLRNVHGEKVEEEDYSPAKGKKRDLKGAELRKRELEQRKMANKITIVVALALIGIVGFGIYYGLSGGDSGEGYQPTSQSQPPQTQAEVRIPLSQISDAAKFYTYDATGVDIRYFAVSGSDGNTHVAFDACDVCYDAKKGYKQEEEVMKCNNCGKVFSINSIGTENTAGGCWPSYLPMRIDGGDVVIKNSDLEAKKYMFQ